MSDSYHMRGKVRRVRRVIFEQIGIVFALLSEIEKTAANGRNCLRPDIARNFWDCLSDCTFNLLCHRQRTSQITRRVFVLKRFYLEIPCYYIRVCHWAFGRAGGRARVNIS